MVCHLSLYPHEVIEFLIAGSIILLLLVVSVILFLKSKRKLGFYITVLTTVCIVAFFIIRPHWIDYQIHKKTIVLEEYLHDKYPDTTWTIAAVNHRENKTFNPYYLLVDFSDDPHHTYYYFVDRKGGVEQMGGESDEYLSIEPKYSEVD